VKAALEDIDDQISPGITEGNLTFIIDEDLRKQILEMAMQIYAVRGGDLVKQSKRLFDTNDAITAACMMLTQIKNDEFLKGRLEKAAENVRLPMFLESTDSKT